MLTVADVVAWNFEILLSKFNIVKIFATGKAAHKWNTTLCIY